MACSICESLCCRCVTPLCDMLDNCFHRLASTNCIPFPSEAEDAQCLTRFLGSIYDVFQLELPSKQQMRHTSTVGPAAAVDTTDSLARVPLAVPQLPAQLCVREDIIFTLRDHLLHVGTDRETNKVVAHGQGGCGKTMVSIQSPPLDDMMMVL